MEETVGKRRGISGDGNRPWVAIWLMNMERAMDRAGIPGERRAALKAALGDFLLEFRLHPGNITPWEIRDYLFRNGELGSRPDGRGPASHRSLGNTIEAVAFFFESVLDRPALAEAARRPFDGGGDWEDFEDRILLDLLREKLMNNGAPGYLFATDGSRDWSAA